MRVATKDSHILVALCFDHLGENEFLSSAYIIGKTDLHRNTVSRILERYRELGYIHKRSKGYRNRVWSKTVLWDLKEAIIDYELFALVGMVSS